MFSNISSCTRAILCPFSLASLIFLDLQKHLPHPECFFWLPRKSALSLSSPPCLWVTQDGSYLYHYCDRNCRANVSVKACFCWLGMSHWRFRSILDHFYVSRLSYGLCWRGRGWEDLGEWHWNMCNTMYETSCQSRFDTQYWMLGAGALGRLRGMVWGGRREGGSGWGAYVYLWRIHFDVWQN